MTNELEPDEVKKSRATAIKNATDYGKKRFVLFQYDNGKYGWALDNSPLSNHILGIKTSPESEFACYENPRNIEIVEQGQHCLISFPYRYIGTR
jgi:hypothetical protein